MHHTGSQENEVGPEELEETQEQELPEGPKPEGDLQECPDYRPSTFERGMPWSILSLPILANLNCYIIESPSLVLVINDTKLLMLCV